MSILLLRRMAFMGGGGPPAFPSTPYAVFSKGYNTQITKYSFATGVSTSGANIATARYSSCVFGNLSFAVFAGDGEGGEGVSSTDKYTFATSTIAPGVSLGVTAMSYASSISNSTVGVSSSYYNAGLIYVSRVYTFASNTMSSGGSLTTAVLRGGAVGEATFGIFIGGENASFAKSTLSCRYTYSGNTTAASSSLTLAKSECKATGNTTFGIIGGGRAAAGDSYTTEKFTFASSTITAGTDLTTNGPGLAATGDVNTGFWAGGYGNGGSDTKVSKYTFSNNSVVTGTSLVGPGTSDGGAASTAPGGW